MAVLTVTAILIDIAVTIVIEIVVALFGDGFGVTGAAVADSQASTTSLASEMVPADPKAASQRPVLKHNLSESAGSILDVAFSKDGKWLATASGYPGMMSPAFDNAARIYDLKSSKPGAPPSLKYTIATAQASHSVAPVELIAPAGQGVCAAAPAVAT